MTMSWAAPVGMLAVVGVAIGDRSACDDFGDADQSRQRIREPLLRGLEESPAVVRLLR